MQFDTAIFESYRRRFVLEKWKESSTPNYKPGLLAHSDVKILGKVSTTRFKKVKDYLELQRTNCSSSLPEVLAMFLEKLFEFYDQSQTLESTANHPRYPSAFTISGLHARYLGNFLGKHSGFANVYALFFFTRKLEGPLKCF